jgi:hypothetical protein
VYSNYALDKILGIEQITTFRVHLDSHAYQELEIDALFSQARVPSVP